MAAAVGDDDTAYAEGKKQEICFVMVSSMRGFAGGAAALMVKFLMSPRSPVVVASTPVTGKKIVMVHCSILTGPTTPTNLIETQAALYNKVCCHVYRGEGKSATDCLRTALREYDLKFSTILNDPDLASFRALPEFKELQEETRLGGEDIGYSFRRDLKLISEVQVPFRGVRRFFYVTFAASAGISTLFTVPRLFLAIKGGDGAPDLWGTAGNCAINIGGIVFLLHYLSGTIRKKKNSLHKSLEMKPCQDCHYVFPPIELLSSCSCETLLGLSFWLEKRRRSLELIKWPSGFEQNF